jgi:hypothetical protein
MAEHSIKKSRKKVMQFNIAFDTPTAFSEDKETCEIKQLLIVQKILSQIIDQDYFGAYTTLYHGNVRKLFNVRTTGIYGYVETLSITKFDTVQKVNEFFNSLNSKINFMHLETHVNIPDLPIIEFMDPDPQKIKQYPEFCDIILLTCLEEYIHKTQYSLGYRSPSTEEYKCYCQRIKKSNSDYNEIDIIAYYMDKHIDVVNSLYVNRYQDRLEYLWWRTNEYEKNWKAIEGRFNYRHEKK